MEKELNIFIILTIISITCSQHAPKIIVQPINFINGRAISRSHSEGLVIPCTATGQGTITYAWRHNGRPLQADQRVKIQGGNLTFSGIVLADAGQYMCLATNGFGTSVSRAATLQVRYLPFLPGNAHKVSRISNNNVKITCNISPNTAPRPDKIYWTKTDSNSIVKENKRIAISRYEGDLIFISGLRNESGSYRCNTISNIYDPKSSSSSATTLAGGVQTVNFSSAAIANTLPKIEIPPNDTIAEIGQNKSILECIATGHPLPAILWSKKSGTLPINRYKFENFGRHLVIENIQESDYGDYQCTAISNGNQVSASARLYVVSEPRWSISISDRNHSIESDLMWPCSAAGSSIKYKWFMNGDLITGSSKYLLHSNGSLTIRNLARSDSKVYTCMAYNDRSNVVSSGWLNVTVAAPSFIKSPYIQTSLFKGEDGVIRCTVTGGPRPTMAYTKDDRFIDLLRNAKYSIMKNGNLVIHNVVENDAGNYKCMATNRFGTASVAGIAVVTNATVFTRKPITTTVRRPQNVRLTCQVQKDSSLPVVLYWQKNGVNITNPRSKVSVSGFNTEFNFVNTTLADSGTYACVAATKLPYQGFVSKISKAQITVHDVPNPPFNFVYSELSSSSILFSWLPGNPNNSPLLGFKIKYRINGVNSWRIADNSIPVSATFHRISLSPFNTYQFAIVAINKVGTSADSKYLYFATPSDVPYRAPGKFRASAVTNDATSINIRFIPLSREEQNDLGFNYRLHYRLQQQSNTSWSNVTTGITGRYRLTGLLPGRRYQLRLQPFNNAGLGKMKTSILTVTTGTSPPAVAPSNVVAYVTDTNQVTLTWNKIPSNKVSAATGYRVSYWTYDRSIALTRTLGDINMATIAGLDSNMNYSFTVNAFNEGGDGPLSSIETKTIKNPVPGAVSNIVASQPAANQITLKWKAPLVPNGAILHYRINYTLLNSQNIPEVAVSNTTTSSETAYVLSNLGPGIYRFTIIPGNAHGYGIPTSIQFDVIASAIPAPIDLAGSNIQETSVDLIWTATNDPLIGFIIRSKLALQSSSFSNSSQLLSPKLRRFTVKNLISSTMYTFHVIAVGSNNKFSSPSNEVNITTAVETAPQSSMMIGIIGGLAGFSAVIFIIASIFFYRRSQQKKTVIKGKKPVIPPRPTSEAEADDNRPPLPSDSGNFEDQFNHSDVDAESVDSMDQYADLPNLSKFNENGSFIGEYGTLRIVTNAENSSYGAHYTDIKYSNAGSVSVRSGTNTRPGSPASTVNHNNAGFLTFV
ncbi:Contactin-3 [Trichoplax sp. H2]|nr:Contactin-3 [Trichoplax sp. H2]|eukprot:RDD40649.1 Contactin-3 [Trichoplax sp. H2]